MANAGVSRRRWRKPVVYSLALIVAGATGATAVFLTGSANRRADRAAIEAYERAALPPIREGGRIVQQEMKPTLQEMAEGRISDADLLGRTAAWRGVFERSRDTLLSLEPPSFLGDIEAGWSGAMGAYLVAVDAFATFARSGAAARPAMLDNIRTLGERADDLFDRVAGVIQFHRRRLGLGPSGNLPDVAPAP